MIPTIQTSFQQGGIQGTALLGPGGSSPDLPVQGLQLSVGLQVHLWEEDESDKGNKGFLHVDGVVAGWNEKYQCWFATYDWDALRWSPELDGPNLESNGDPILFNEWVRRVFDHEVIDHSWWWNEDTAWNELSPQTSVEYLSLLFEESTQLLRPYSDAQVDQGLWLIIELGSDHAYAISNSDVDWPARQRCVRSILRLFECFAARCTSGLAHLDEPGLSPLNSICYMFWDIFPMHGQPDEPTNSELDQSLLGVMTEILALSSDAGQESALHGLGHWQRNYPNEVNQIVTHFLSNNQGIRPELRKYAERARRGAVQ